LQSLFRRLEKSGLVQEEKVEHRDLWSSLFWAGIGVIFCVGGLQYGFGSAGVPGPGFLPFLVGAVLFGLSLLLLFLSILRRGADLSIRGVTTDASAKEKAKRILLVLGALLFYVIAFERLGFLITSVVFMIFLIRLNLREWRFVLLAAFSFTAFVYILFKLLLRVPLSQGIFGF
jgi:putative tricarboxylic transport membrane protein